MKFLALLALVICTTAGAASVGPNSSWKAIAKAGLIAGFPTIGFQTEGVTVDELCVDGDMLRPIQPLRTTCAVYDTKTDRSHRCLKYVTTSLSTPIAYEEAVCVKTNAKGDECRKWGTVPATHATTYNVSVYKDTVRAGLVEVFTKNFEIPCCE